MADYNAKLNARIAFYLEANGLKPDDYRGKFELYDNGRGGDAEISRWDIATIKLPTAEALKSLSSAAVDRKAAKKLLITRLDSAAVPILKQAEINQLADSLRDGWLFVNIDTGKLNYVSAGKLYELPLMAGP